MHSGNNALRKQCTQKTMHSGNKALRKQCTQETMHSGSNALRKQCTQETTDRKQCTQETMHSGNNALYSFSKVSGTCKNSDVLNLSSVQSPDLIFLIHACS